MTTSPSLSASQRLIRLAIIGLTPILLLLLFLWTGGWLTPNRLSADRLVTILQQSSGHHPGFRRNHAKGICVSGNFYANGAASSLSRASVFNKGTTPVVGRFAIAGGNPNAPDYAVPVRSLALDFKMANGQQWRTGMNAIPFFPVATVKGFYDQQIASRPDPTTGKPDPAKMAIFFQQHPEAKAFFSWAKSYVPSSSWSNVAYNSLNTFQFTNGQGVSHLVRWRLAPQQPWLPIGAAQKQNPLFLQQDLQQRLAQGALKWDLLISVAQAGDAVNDASLPWPEDRQMLNAGTLVLDHSSNQQGSDCNNINYDPLILPDGIAGSDDPLLNARSATYAKSYNRRTQEEAHAL